MLDFVGTKVQSFVGFPRVARANLCKLLIVSVISFSL